LAEGIRCGSRLCRDVADHGVLGRLRVGQLGVKTQRNNSRKYALRQSTLQVKFLVTPEMTAIYASVRGGEFESYWKLRFSPRPTSPYRAASFPFACVLPQACGGSATAIRSRGERRPLLGRGHICFLAGWKRYEIDGSAATGTRKRQMIVIDYPFWSAEFGWDELNLNLPVKGSLQVAWH
jgi:hypothetical protein